MRLLSHRRRFARGFGVSAALGAIQFHQAGSLDEAVARMEEAYKVLGTEEADVDLATLAAELGRLLYFKGEVELAAERVDTALEIAEGLGLPEVISQALNTKGIVATARARPEEGFALLNHALKVALQHDRPNAALRALTNLAELTWGRDQYAEAIELHGRALDLASRVGNLAWLELTREATPYPLFMAGRWDEALERAGDYSSWSWIGEISPMLAALPTICVNRGIDAGLARLEALAAELVDTSDVQRTGGRAVALAVLRGGEGNHAEALDFAKDAVRQGLKVGADSPLIRIGFAQAVDSAFALGDLAQVDEALDLLAGLRRGEVWPSLAALGERTNARLAAARGVTEGVEGRFRAAAETFREIGMSYWLAATLTEHGEWLIAEGRSEEAGGLIAEASEIFERLQARPWLDRLDRLRADSAAVLTVG